MNSGCEKLVSSRQAPGVGIIQAKGREVNIHKTMTVPNGATKVLIVQASLDAKNEEHTYDRHRETPSVHGIMQWGRCPPVHEMGTRSEGIENTAEKEDKKVETNEQDRAQGSIIFNNAKGTPKPE